VSLTDLLEERLDSGLVEGALIDEIAHGQRNRLRERDGSAAQTRQVAKSARIDAGGPQTSAFLSRWLRR